MSGIRVELAFEAAPNCPVAAATDTGQAEVTDVTRSVDGDDTVTEQVRSAADIEQFETVFEYGTDTVYQFEREYRDCICEFLEREVGPVTDISAENGRLQVTLHLDDAAALRESVDQLRERFGQFHIESLVEGSGAAESGEVVPVDLDRLTDRQREVVETAYEMGYFEYPRGSNATEVSAELGIDTSTFSEHLAAAQGKLLDELVD